MAIPAHAMSCRYRYDPLDRLVASGPVSETGTQRFYQKNRLATEIQGTLKRTIFQHEDVVLAQQHLEGKAVKSLLATDRQRSVLQCLDEAGLESLAYTAYGHHPTDSGLTSLLGFNGERRDPITGYYMLGNGYRAFNPVLMRFNSSDDLSPFGEGGLNAYAYCQGDPVNYLDPTGHAPFSVIFKSGLSQHSTDYLSWLRARGPSAARPIAPQAAPSSLAKRYPVMLGMSERANTSRTNLDVQQLSSASPVASTRGGYAEPLSQASTSRAGGTSGTQEVLNHADRQRISKALKYKLKLNQGKAPFSRSSIVERYENRIHRARTLQDHYEDAIQKAPGNFNHKRGQTGADKLFAQETQRYAAFLNSEHAVSGIRRN